MREAGTGLFSTRANRFNERDYEKFVGHIGRLFDENSKDTAVLSKRVEFLNSITASSPDEKVLTPLRAMKVKSLGLLAASINPADWQERLKLYAQMIELSKQKPQLPELAVYEIWAGGTLMDVQREKEAIPYLESGLQRQGDAHVAVSAIMLDAELWLGDAYLHTGNIASAQRIYEMVEKQTEDKPQFFIFYSKSFSRRAVLQENIDLPEALALTEKSYAVLTKSGAASGAAPDAAASQVQSATNKELLDTKASYLLRKRNWPSWLPNTKRSNRGKRNYVAVKPNPVRAGPARPYPLNL